jgi:hypothetical protein
MTTIDGNKLIANSKFSNAKLRKVIKADLKKHDENYVYGSLKYHLSWDWLMPIIEGICCVKFEDGDIVFPRTFGMINSDTGQFMFRFNRYGLFMADTLIDAAYTAVIEYLTHNSTQSTP